MPLRRRILVLCLALMLALGCLSGCQVVDHAARSFLYGSSGEPTPEPQSVEAAAEATPAAEPTPEPTPEPSPESVKGDEAIRMLKSYHISTFTENGEVKLEKNHLYIGHCSTPSDGVFWYQYTSQGNSGSYYMLLDLEGRVLFATDQCVRYASDFQDGAAFMTLAEGEYKIGSDFGYEPVRIDEQYDIIVDKTGHTLYDTRWDPEWEQEILAQGGGKFAVIRHRETDAGEAIWELGTIDAEGREVDPFRTYTEAEHYGDIRLSNVRKMLSSKTTGMYTDLIPKKGLTYLGDDTFVLPSGSYRGLVYQPGRERLIVTYMDRFVTHVGENGRAFACKDQDQMLYLYDLETGERCLEKECSSPAVTGDTVMVGNQLMDTELNPVLTLRIDGCDEECEYKCGPFYGDLAAVIVYKPSYGGTRTFLTLIDRSGHNVTGALEMAPVSTEFYPVIMNEERVFYQSNESEDGINYWYMIETGELIPIQHNGWTPYGFLEGKVVSVQYYFWILPD